jgi:hypothetical protein
LLDALDLCDLTKFRNWLQVVPQSGFGVMSTIGTRVDPIILRERFLGDVVSKGAIIANSIRVAAV